MKRLLWVGFVLLWVIAAAMPVEAAGPPYVTYLPQMMMNASNRQPIIINHLNTNISSIPDAWLTEAKKQTVHFAHTSHGSQILTGLVWLESRNAKYNVAVRNTGSGLGLPVDTTALRFYDGNNYSGNDYITPDLYWDSLDGRNHTVSVAATGSFSNSMWSWCGQQSDNSDATVNRYLNTMKGWEQTYPAMRFILMTGHTDSSGTTGTLEHNNQLVKTFALNNNMVLFDFADIERYDPAGGYHPETTDACSWCSAWCTAHPADCANFSTMGDCAHSHKLICKLKAQAYWWLMARLSGWQP